MFSNCFLQILKLKSTPSHHPRLTALMCVNVPFVAPTGLPESIHHLFVMPVPQLPLLSLCPGQLCARRAFPHCFHHPHLPFLTSHPGSHQPGSFPAAVSLSCFLPAFSQKLCQGNWASLSTARSDTAPLTAATGSSTSAQPTRWEESTSTVREHRGLHLSSQTHCPPPIQQAGRREKLLPKKQE